MGKTELLFVSLLLAKFERLYYQFCQLLKFPHNYFFRIIDVLIYLPWGPFSFQSFLLFLPKIKGGGGGRHLP